MNIASMTKEQKQMVLLGVIGGVFSLYALVTFGIAPIKAKWASSGVELEELSDKLRKAEKSLRNKAKTKKDGVEVATRLKDAGENHIPDTGNTLSWVTQRIYAHARVLNLDLESVAPSSAGMCIVKLDAEGVPNRKFDIYTVRVATSAGYNDVMEFISVLEKSNKYLTISGLSITSSRKTPDQHKVDIDVQWPIWSTPEGPRQIRTAEDQIHG